MKKLFFIPVLLFLTLCAHSQHSVTIYNKGNGMMEKGNYKKALQLFSRAIRLDRFFPEAYYNRAWVKAKLGDYAGAIMDCSKAIDRNPQFKGAYNNRGMNRDKI